MSNFHLHLPPQKAFAPVRFDLVYPGTTGEKTLLMVGNSLTHFNLMPKMLEKMLQATDGEVWRVSSVTRGGATLDWHVQTGLAVSVLRSLPWNGVVLQDQSIRPRQEPEASRDDLETLTACATELGIPATAYATWDVEGGPSRTWQGIEDTLMDKGDAPRWQTARVGRIWEAVEDLYPDVAFRRDDGVHPTELGSFLATMVLCHTLSGGLPERLPEQCAAGGYAEPDLQGRTWEELREVVLGTLSILS